MKITIIGSKGMLGRMVCDYFNKFTNDFEFIIAKKFEIDKEEEFLESLGNPDYVINCSGAIPQRAPNTQNQNELEKYYSINNSIPILLIENNFKVIHPCTDCVYKGDPQNAPYSINSKFDCEDLYGKSKSRLYYSHQYKSNKQSIKVIRTSIVGPDNFNNSLYSWSLSMVKSSRLIKGYINHFWNGITTLKWAEICLSIVKDFDSYPSISVYGTNTISKYELIRNILISNELSPDIFLKPVKADEDKDKSLLLGPNNLGDIFPLLKNLTEFQRVLK